MNWAEWSGEAAIRQLHIPVLLVGGGKDSISRPDDIATLRTAAVGKVEAIHINEANHFVLPMWFHELANPVEAWFHAQIGKPTVRNAVQQ